MIWYDLSQQKLYLFVYATTALSHTGTLFRDKVAQKIARYNRMCEYGNGLTLPTF